VAADLRWTRLAKEEQIMRRRSSSWLGLTLILTVASALVFGAAGGAADPNPTSVVVAPEQAAATIEQLTGFVAPRDSCLANPSRSGCPYVKEVVITLPDGGDAGSTAYVPLDDQTSGPAATSDVNQPVGVCAVFATVGVYYVARGNHQNSCPTGAGITEMEMWGFVQRFSVDHWNNLASCERGPYYGATTQQCSTSYNCYHPNAYRYYRAETNGYAVQRGTGFFGTDHSELVQSRCH
jgi:hypothetical protein